MDGLKTTKVSSDFDFGGTYVGEKVFYCRGDKQLVVGAYKKE